MLGTSKLRGIYSKIQTQVYNMIPEKWDKICLYASIIEQVNHMETGEMFFYYFPTGLLRRKPVNVYEIPTKFNIEEDEYMILVNKLYRTISELRAAFKESTEEKMWSNFTIVIENSKFNVDYYYDDLLGSPYTSSDRHIIWKCKYLDYPIERLTKKERKMVEEYYEYEESQQSKKYMEGTYRNNPHNVIKYDRDVMEIKNKNSINKIQLISRKKINEDVNDNLSKKSKRDKYELYKMKQEEAKRNLTEKEDIRKKIEERNMILNIKNDRLKSERNEIINKKEINGKDKKIEKSINNKNQILNNN